MALVGHVSHLRRKPEIAAACRRILWTPRDPTSTLWTFAASVPRRLHVRRTPYPPESGLPLNASFITCRTRQPPGPQGRGCCCMSVDALDPQRPDQDRLDVRFIRPKALARVAHPLPTRNWHSLKRCLWNLQGASATCTPRQRLLLHVSRCSGPPGTRPAPIGRSLHPSQGACTCGAPLTHQKLSFP